MNKILSLILVATLFIMVACGGGDSTEEPTTSPSPTPTVTVEASPTPTPTPEPTEEPSPTTPAVDNSVETVLASVSNLIVAHAEVDGKWKGYQGNNVDKLTTLKKGNMYWVYAATEGMSQTSGFSISLNQGWQKAGPIMWMNQDDAANVALQDDLDNIIVVVGFDNITKKYSLYLSSVVTPLTEIKTGQEYCTFAGAPPTPKTSCQTR